MPASDRITAAGSDLSARIDAVLAQALAERRLVGAVVLAARHGELLHGRAAGLADRESGQPMRVDTVFRFASVSKPIVSATALVLVAQGRLALDEDITRWLPAFAPPLPSGGRARITPRQLLSHTAGLGYRFLEGSDDGPYARAGVSDGMDRSGLTLAENLRRLAGVPLRYVPGTAWGYSLATDVLGAVIERASGLPLAAAVRTLVTEPLGMAGTGFAAAAGEPLATAYVNDSPAPHRLREDEVVPVFPGTVGIRFSPARAFDPAAFASGGGGMVGTAPDVLRLLEALRRPDGGLLPADLVRQMGEDQTGGATLPAAPGYGFGLGFSVLRDAMQAQSPETPGTWRWGGAYGHQWFVDPARGLSVVALTNTLYEGMSGRFVTDLRDAVYAAAEVRQ